MPNVGRLYLTRTPSCLAGHVCNVLFSGPSGINHGGRRRWRR